jgi:hypothetical protein
MPPNVTRQRFGWRLIASVSKIAGMSDANAKSQERWRARPRLPPGD